jgi:hypothetical protein
MYTHRRTSVPVRTGTLDAETVGELPAALVAPQLVSLA